MRMGVSCAAQRDARLPRAGGARRVPARQRQLRVGIMVLATVFFLAKVFEQFASAPVYRNSVYKRAELA
jgi:hypothetical protein